MSVVLAAVLFLALPALSLPGRLDPSFGGGDGMVTNDFGASDHGHGVLVLRNGKILQVGETNPGTGGDPDFAIARYKPGGARDNTFGGDGRITTDFFGGDDGAWAIARYGRNRFVVAGWAEGPAGDDHFALARYNTNGSLDDSFGGDGKVVSNFPNRGFAYDVLVLADRSIIAVGEDFESTTGVKDFALVKYHPNGSRDRSFDGNGTQTTDFHTSQDGAWDAVMQGNRLLVTGGGAEGPEPEDYDVALARYRMNGLLDRSWQGDGKRLIPVTLVDDWGTQMVPLEDGRIVMAVRANNGDVGLLRLRPGGALDQTFGGGDGKVIRDFGGSEDATGLVRVGPQWVLCGRTSDEQDMAVWRFRRNGSLDAAFGGDGEAVSMYPDSASGNEIARHNGAVVVSGETANNMALSRFLLN